VKYITVPELIENWVRLHEYMQEDAAKLQFVSWVKLEDFVAGPRRYCSLRHQARFETLISPDKRHPMTWRALSAL